MASRLAGVCELANEVREHPVPLLFEILERSGLRCGERAERRHTFQVRAIDAVGNVDKTPAKKTWRVTGA